MLRCAGLFSGIGGFSLAARWMGWVNVFEVEKDDWCRKVLHKNFPESQLFEDVCTFDGRPFRGLIDILCGGFPCQPWSDAGQKLGTADPRHLWPQFLRIIREIRPRVVVGENVRGLLSWNGGVQFEAVCADLEAEGYEVQPVLLPASGIGAIHQRERIWFCAYSSHINYQRGKESARQTGRDGPARIIPQLSAYTTGIGRETGESRALYQREGQNPTQVGDSQWQAILATIDRCSWPLTEPPLCVANDGLPSRLLRPDRANILKAAGNAIVPQVAYQIFQAIEATL